jgi:hypothetical protein
VRRSTGCGVAIAVSILATVGGCTPQVRAGGGARASADVVTPAGAIRIVRAYWPINERGIASRDIAVFAQVESDMLLEVDRGVMQANKALGEPVPAAPRPLRKVTAYVPTRGRGAALCSHCIVRRWSSCASATS